ncbi:MAG TPA: SDR family oxidoreductase [Solirubrobacterales bacterium]|nr:SDR family oxidoreductase [Solirubrobacterales bacterium]
MTATLVTGASGFIGTHLVRALAERGDDLRLLARRSSNLDHLEGIEFDRVTGDVTDRRAVRRAMKGVGRVFHVAGTTSMRPGSAERVFEINVVGTRTVLEEALRAEVERVVHTSSAGAVGPAKPGGTADENQAFTAGHLGIAYINSKHEAEVEAFRVAAHGLDLVVVNPTFVLGPDDPTGTSNGLIKRALLRQIPFYVDGGLNVVDVRDVAQGHVLADRKGKPGERYLIGGRNFTFDRLFADVGRISGVPPPPIKVPLELTRVAAGLGRRIRIPVPVSDDELVSAAQWWTYRCTKAKRELGFKPRPHEETLEDAVRWQMDRLGDRLGRAPRSDLAMRAFGRFLQAGERVGLG